MQPSVVTERSGPRKGWLSDAIIAGFVATGAFTVAFILAYLGANAAAREDGDFVSRWLWELTHNTVVTFGQAQPAVSIALHTAFGILWALVYARFFEPRSSRGGWQAGVRFAFIPWLASIFIFLPATGAGFLGLGLGAGILPVVGNFVLHLVYGAVLGQLYDRSADRPDTAEDAPDAALQPLEGPAVQHSEGLAAAGIIGGLVVGAVMGLGFALALPPSIDGVSLDGWSIAVAIGGALAGAAVGAMVGTFAGLPQGKLDPAERTMGSDPFERNVLIFMIPLCIIIVLGLGIAGFGTFMLQLDKVWAVVAAGAATIAIGILGPLVARRQESRSPDSTRETVSHSGH